MVDRASGETADGRTRQVRAWDLPTRLFHWLLVLAILSAYATRRFIDEPTLFWHRINGYAVLTLLVFRLVWGVYGASTARFAAWLPGPRAVLRHAMGLLRRDKALYLGHNPLGSLSIVALLLAVVAQAVSGLFTSDDVLAQGPMVDHATDWLVARMSAYHAKGFGVILGLAALHVVANLAYQFGLRDPVVTAMLTGNKPARPYVDQRQALLVPAWRAWAALAASGLIVVMLLWLMGAIPS